MKIVVYGTRLSPFVEKLVRGVLLKKLDYELVEPKTPLDLRRWNPVTGKMPVAEIDGEKLYDSTFILRRLDELVPDPPLVSRESGSASSQRLLEDWADESLYWYTMAFRWTDANASATAHQILSNVPALLRPLLVPVVRRQIGGMTRAQGLGRLPVEVLVREYGGLLDDLEVLLAGRPFFFGDCVSQADLAVYAQLHMADNEVTPETRKLVRDRPWLVEYMKHVEQATGG